MPYVLTAAGVAGLFVGLFFPWVPLPAVAGGPLLILGLYGTGALSVETAGPGLIALGIAFVASGVDRSPVGALAFGGVASLVAGAGLAFPRGMAAEGVPWPALTSMAVLAAGAAIGIVAIARDAHRRPVVSGREALAGRWAIVESWSPERCCVCLAGERWRARAPDALEAGDAVRVVGITGGCLDVEPVDDVGEGGPS